MTITARRVTLAAPPAGTAPTVVELVGAADSRHPGSHVTVVNSGANPAELGGPGLAVDTGLPLAAGAQLQLPLQLGDALYVVSAAGTTLAVLVTGA